MGREIREVPKNWNHPKDENKTYIPLIGRPFKKELARFNEHKKKWDEGFMESFTERGVWVSNNEYASKSYEQWDGEKPAKKDYMPEWPEADKTHIQLYESTTEGTPISPVFSKKNFEKLCEYAAKHCSTFADFRATKTEWMEMLKNDFVHHRAGNKIFI